MKILLRDEHVTSSQCFVINSVAVADNASYKV